MIFPLRQIAYTGLSFTVQSLFAQVKGIKLRPESVVDGVSALISFKDIPGENIGVKNRLGSEPLFADEFTRCA